jgi:hypothetical protein
MLSVTLRTAGIATLLKRALGTAVYARMVDRVAALAQDACTGGTITTTTTTTTTTLTWGEFLLLLLPDSPTGTGYARSALTPAERVSVSASVPGVWSDEEWSFVPLQIDASDTEGTGSGSECGSRNAYARLDAAALRKEVDRLARERAFLLKKLSGSAYSMER